MSSLFKRSNGVFYVVFHDATRKPTRKFVSTGETNRRKAQGKAKQIEAEVHTGTRVLWPSAPTAPKTPARKAVIFPSSLLQEAVAPFLATKAHLAQATKNDYGAVTGRFVQWVTAETEVKEVQQVETEHVAGFIAWANVKPVTRHTYRRHLRVFFRWLVDQGALAQDPTVEVRLERAPLKHPRFLTPEDVEAVCAAIKKPCKYGRAGSGLWVLPIVRANVYLGLRLGEVVNLRWEDVSLDRRMVVVRCTEEFTTKAGRDRTIPLAEAPLGVLASMERRGAYVFTNHSGGKLDRDHLSRTFKRYVRRAGVSEEIDFHAMRHTAASWLMMHGASIEAVRQYLGHSSITVTQRYAHLSAKSYFEQVNAAFKHI